MLRVATLFSAIIFFGSLEVQVQGDDSGKAKPHMLSYANSYAGSIARIYPGIYGGGLYPYGFGMGMPFGGGLGYGMSPFSMYSAGKAGKKLPEQ